ncbi:MAG: hypothetical protein PHV59_03450 [Victivallales bacterium]|nr:hypothetical protein [Victivallales bacterium]
MNSKKLKKVAKEYGADLVGIGSMDRWEGAELERDPRYIFPEAKSCISLAFRIPRGYLRGIEEGTCFAPYTALGYAGINEVYAPKVIRELCCYIEDHGYEAVPQPNIYLKPNVGPNGSLADKTIPVRPGYPRPDIMIDQRIAAYICGLGEFGWSKVFLTPEFGPLQRFVSILTDAELDSDPIFEGKICDRCMSCVRECTGQAISKYESFAFTVAGHKVEFGKIDLNKCAFAYRGGNPEYNPFIPADTTPEELDEFKKKWNALGEAIGLPLYQRHASALEGAAGCMRACYIHLEKTGKLKKRFKSPFRKRTPWRIDRSQCNCSKGPEIQNGDMGQPDTNVLM